MSVRDLEARLVDMEIRYTYQEKALDELGQLVFEQAQELERLRSRLALVSRHLADPEPDEPG